MSAARMQSCLGAWIIVLTVVFYAFPAYSMYSWAAIGLTAAAAVLAGTRMHRPAKRLPWYLLATVVASFTAGDLTYNILTDFLGRQNPFPSLADAFYLAVYPMLAIALLVFIRVRTSAGYRAVLLDALVPTASLGLLAWVFLIAPYLHDAELTLGEKLTSMAYPLGDVLALAMLFRLVTAGGRRPMALHILGAGVTGLLVTDVLYGLRQLDGAWQVGGPVDAGWVFFYAAIAMSALHPSMPQLTATRRHAARSMTGHRIVAMSLAALIAPGVLVIEELRGGVDDALTIAFASGLVFLLVMDRVADLVKAQRVAAARERALRITAAQLAGASNEKEAAAVVTDAACGLVPAGEPYRFHVHRVEVAPGTPTGQCTMGIVAVADLPAEIGEPLAGFEAALFAGGVSQAWVEGEPLRHSTAFLAAAPELLAAVQSSFEALMSQSALVFERLSLTTEMKRRSSQDYFKALIQSTSDVILIVDDEERIRYASPSALPVFGRTDLVGTSLFRLIAGTDHAELRHVLAEARTGHGRRDGVDLTAVSGDDLLLQVECTCRDLRDDPAVAGLVITIRDVTERRRLEDDLAHQAFHDTLTGLANRALFQNRLEVAARHAEATNATVAVLFVDLDDFKEVNDSLGHAAGDQLLVEVGRRITAAAGQSATAARTGGDEFAVLLDDAGTPEEAERLAARIVESLTRPIELSDGAGGVHLVGGAASVGVATGTDAAGIAELLRRADVAMYQAKTGGKNTWRRYQDDMHEAMMYRLEMRAALNGAVSAGQMRLHFQPIVDLPTGELIGLEALVRWQHPARGLLGPNEFIELSEENGSVVAIGGWVLREALETFAGWRRAVPASLLRYVSVNVSARQFRTPGFVDLVRNVLAETGSRPEWLLLEITESLVLHDADQVWRDLEELRAMGVRIAIDDFGTGYSSLSYLSQMPVDVLKIDKSFIDDILDSPQQMALVETIVSLARTLDLAVVAEGIELDEHRQALVAMGCPYGQGYLFSKPVTAGEISERLTPERPKSDAQAGPEGLRSRR